MICTKCKIEKDISLFWIDKHKKTWYTSACRECRREQHKKYMSTQKGQQTRKNCKILYKLKPNYKEKEKAHSAQWYSNNKEKSKQNSYEFYLKNKEDIDKKRKERLAYYYSPNKKVYYGKLLWKILEVKRWKGCLVKLDNGMTMRIAKSRLKPFKYLRDIEKTYES